MAAAMTGMHVCLTVAIVAAIGYSALYAADDSRKADFEEEVVGIPFRFISLMLVTYSSVILPSLIIGAPATLGGVPFFTFEWAVLTLKAGSIAAIFSVVGAATADSIF